MAMASNRKKGDYSVLSEVNTEEEWNNLIERKGLVVVDVYSEWSGPCSAMTNFLKKIKLEVNDDLLHYAMAKSDTIPQLKCFRGQCKPTWLFMSGGEPVNVMHGANAPLLQKMIEKEIRKTRQVLKGEAFRDPIAFEDAVPTVKNQEKIATNLWADSDDEDADSGAEDAKNEDDSNDSQQNFTILAVEPEIIADDQMLLLFKDILDQEGFSIFQERDVVLTLDDIKFLTSGIKTNEDQMDMLVTKLLEMQVKIYMLRTDEGVKAGKRMNEMIGVMFDEEKEKPENKAKVAKDYLTADADEDISFPEGLRAFFEVLDNDKLPGFLCPDYAGFLGITEKHFYDSLTSVLDDPNVDCSETKANADEAPKTDTDQVPTTDETEEKTANEASDAVEAEVNEDENAQQTEALNDEATETVEQEADDATDEQVLPDIDDPNNDRKALLVFPEDNKDFITAEMENYKELEIKVIGTSCVKLNSVKAQLLMNKRRKIKEMDKDAEHKLLVDLSSKQR